MRGPSIWDRLLGLNLFSIKATLLILVFALDSGYAYLIDIAMAYALLSIIGLIFMCRFIERKGKI